MHTTDWHETLIVLGAFLASAFALARTALSQHRAMTQSLVGFLQDTTARHDLALHGFEAALDRLTDTLRENTFLARQVADRLASLHGDERDA
jgi:hypothetical protein